MQYSEFINPHVPCCGYFRLCDLASIIDSSVHNGIGQNLDGYNWESVMQATWLKMLLEWPAFCLLIITVFYVTQWAGGDQHRGMTLALANTLGSAIVFIGGALFVHLTRRESIKFPKGKNNLRELIAGLRVFWCIYVSVTMLVWLTLQVFPVPVWEMKTTRLADLYCLSWVGSFIASGLLLWWPGNGNLEDFPAMAQDSDRRDVRD